MNIQLSGHHIELSNNLRDYTEKKLTRLKSHESLITNLHLIFKEDSQKRIVEAQISLPGKVAHVEATANTMQEAVDEVMDKIIRQVNKYKEITKDHRGTHIDS